MDDLLSDYPLEPDPTKPSLENITAYGNAFSIPWNHEVRSIMAGFESSRLKDPAGPWLPSCPFDLTEARLAAILQETDGGNTTFRDGMSTHAGSSNEHLSAALGVTVGYPFLNASVSGKYDKNVTENDSGIKASRNTSCRVGRIILDEAPRLAPAALSLLESNEGTVRFRQRYGDYYVCGYELGGDAGACLSATTKSSLATETLELTVKVKVLFYEESATHSETKTEASSSATLNFSGYNSLNDDAKSLVVEGTSASDVSRIQSLASAYLAGVGTLDADVRKKLAQVSLTNSQKLGLSACGPICASGLVVQLLLAPFARLNQFVLHA